MLGLVKMSALSAVLSVGVVTAYNHEPVVARDGGKLYNDRLSGETASPLVTGSTAPASVQPAMTGGRKGDRLAVSSGKTCAAQTWPYLAQACLSRSDGRDVPAQVRVITIETREGLNTSILQRIPQTDIARR